VDFEVIFEFHGGARLSILKTLQFKDVKNFEA
jgi:hypothetical protein